MDKHMDQLCVSADDYNNTLHTILCTLHNTHTLHNTTDSEREKIRPLFYCELFVPGKRSRDVTLPCKAISLAVADLEERKENISSIARSSSPKIAHVEYESVTTNMSLTTSLIPRILPVHVKVCVRSNRCFQALLTSDPRI